MRALLDALLAVLIAPACVVCEQALDEPTRGPVCRCCWESILPFTPPLCEACGEPLPSWRTVSLTLSTCARCRRTSRLVDRARALGPYEGALRAIVHALKYDGRRSIAPLLGARMRARAGDLLEGVDAAIPVPLHPKRQRERGFNQAADLARALGLPVAGGLRRVRATPSQATLPAAQRHANVKGAFEATRAVQRMQGWSVVLVDDVTTTGATLEACARALKANGVQEVRAITAARVLDRRASERW